MNGFDPNGKPILVAKEKLFQTSPQETKKPEVILNIPEKRVKRVWFNFRKGETLKAERKPE